LHLENQCGTFSLLVTTKLEVFASLQGQLGLRLANCALQPQDDFLCCFGLLVEDRLSLTTIS